MGESWNGPGPAGDGGKVCAMEDFSILIDLLLEGNYLSGAPPNLLHAVVLFQMFLEPFFWRRPNSHVALEI